MSIKLSQQQIDQYQRLGYVTPMRVLPETEACGLRAKLQAVEAAQGGKLDPPQRSKAHLLFKWLDDLIRYPPLLDPILQSFGPHHLC